MLENWMQWKRRCAIELCDPESRRELRAFAFSRFERFVRRYASFQGRRNGPISAIRHEDAWHLFETHVTVKHSRRGKRYKDWLFARLQGSGDDPVDVIQGGATLILRDVTREYLRRECSDPRTVSLDQPLGNPQESGPALADLLASGTDPGCEAALNEYKALANEHAAGLFEDATRRERVAMLARATGLSMAHPEVEEAAGCRKSVLCSAYRDFVTRVGSVLRREYPQEDPESVLTLALLVVDKTGKLAVSWAESEKVFAGLFQINKNHETSRA